MPAQRRITPDVEQRALGAIMAGADLGIAARVARVSRQALYKHRAKNPEFDQAIKEAKRFADERVVRSLYKAAIAGNTTAMIFWLKNRHPEKWRDRHEIAAEVEHGIRREVSFADGQAFTTSAATVPGGRPN